MLFKCINFFQKKILILLVFLSFALFWWRAVGGNINFINICILLVGVAIILPVFCFTENLRVQIKKIFGGKHKYLKLCLYIISISTFYSIILTISYYPITFTTLFNFLIVLISIPFFILILKLFFIDKLKISEWSKVFLFIIVILVFDKAYLFIVDFFSYYKIYHFALLRIYTPNIAKCFNLLPLWGIQFPIILVLLSDISSDDFGFHREWDRKAIVVTLFILSIIAILNFQVFRNVNINNKQYVLWNMLTFFYHSLIVSFSEEIIFRGIIQNHVSKKLASIKDGNIVAIIITSVLFSLVHFPFSEDTIGFNYAFYLGLFFGWIYNKTQNIWPSILVHGIHNLIISAIII